jgi:carboxypeptidase Q
MKKNITSSVFLFVLIPFLAFSQAKTTAADKFETPSADSIFRKIGISQSKVSDIAWDITDGNGPRMTGSAGLDRATVSMVERLKSWNLANVHTEEWGPFGRGWELQSFQLESLEPFYMPLIAYPKAWSSPINGTKTAEIIYLNAGNEKDLEKYRGKLTGKIVLLDTIRDSKEWTKPLTGRHDDKSLLELANAPKPVPSSGKGWGGASSANFGKALWAFLYDEKPLAILDRQYKGDFGTVFVSQARAKATDLLRKNGEFVIPQITVSNEQYNRLFRTILKGEKVNLRVRLEAKYLENDPMERNIIAEIAGSDKASEVVMFGAHFDSWHTGTGATDNGAGSAVMVEAARILQEYIKESGEKPRRTLRLALWTGEEQGLLGSNGYANQHFVTRDSANDISGKKPENAQISAYFNLDNGTGKIRGIYQQGNDAVGPIFREWLQPWKKQGASTLTVSNTGGTDHLSFDRAGIPGFQFIQDDCEYFVRTHHSNFDTWEHLYAEDMKQAATLVAWFVWQTSQREEMLPRK